MQTFRAVGDFFQRVQAIFWVVGAAVGTAVLIVTIVQSQTNLSWTSLGFIGLATALMTLPLAQVLSAWAGSTIRRFETSSTVTSPVVASSPSSVVGAEPEIELIELKLESLNYREREPWVHLRVINKGNADEFKAEVTNVWYAEQEQTQYTMKWREGTGDVRRVFKDDLLDVARITSPTQTDSPTDSWTPGSTLEAAARESVRFERGYFKLYSAVLPGGWDVYGKKELLDFFDKTNTIPPSERPLRVFDERLELHVRVLGTRGQIASGRIQMGFKRPAWDYDKGNYEAWSEPTAAFVPADGKGGAALR